MRTTITSRQMEPVYWENRSVFGTGDTRCGCEIGTACFGFGSRSSIWFGICSIVTDERHWSLLHPPVVVAERFPHVSH